MHLKNILKQMEKRAVGGALAPGRGTEMQSNGTTRTIAQRHKLGCLSATLSVDATSQFMPIKFCTINLHLCSQAGLRRSRVSRCTLTASGGRALSSKMPPQSHQTSLTRLKDQQFNSPFTLFQSLLKHFSVFSLTIFSTLLFSAFHVCFQSFFS